LLVADPANSPDQMALCHRIKRAAVDIHIRGCEPVPPIVVDEYIDPPEFGLICASAGRSTLCSLVHALTCRHVLLSIH